MRTLTITLLVWLLSVSSLLYAAEPAALPTTPFDQYGTPRWEDEKPRLDNFAIELQNDKSALGFFLVSDKTGGCPGEAQARAIRAKRYMVEHRGVPWNRVIWRREGYRPFLQTTLLIVPPGVKVPYPLDSDSMSPAVDGPLARACRNKLKQIKSSRW